MLFAYIGYLSRQSVSKWEKGDGYPEIEKLIQLSKLLNVSFDLLFADDSPQVIPLKQIQNSCRQELLQVLKTLL
jgi:transcriptional regulator with XRE-family HTH domain